MSQYQVGDITFHVSPVSIMQCWVGIGWSASGSSEAIEEFCKFTGCLFPYLLAQDCEEPVSSFCAAATAEIDRIVQDEALRTDFLTGFARRLKGRLSPDNQCQATRLSAKYASLVEGWLHSPVGRCGADAAAQIAQWGLQLPGRALGAVASFGNAIFGKYVHAFNAVCVQLDVVAQTETPEVEFLDTLLHEGIHGAIYREMGDDDDRPELTWLNELCALLTSQAALRVASEKHLDDAGSAKLDAALDRIRSSQKYGALAEAVLRDTGDDLIAMKAWKRILALSSQQRRDYARERVIKPILHDLGWKVEFPFEYGDKYVTVYL